MDLFSPPLGLGKSKIPTTDNLLTGVKVRCSADQNTGDPENSCRDKPVNPATCAAPPGTNAPSNGDAQLEAYTSPYGKTYWGVEYTQTTFCKKFFETDMRSLSDAITYGKDSSKHTPAQQNDLLLWNNRARVFVHEACHYNYFVDAAGTVPYIDDVTFEFKVGKKTFPS